jgi:hypothetical protein
VVDADSRIHRRVLTLSLVSVASEAVGVLNCERGILNGRLRCDIDLKKKETHRGLGI